MQSGHISVSSLHTYKSPNSNVFQSLHSVICQWTFWYMPEGFQSPACIWHSNSSSLHHVSLSFNHTTQNLTKSNGESQDGNTSVSINMQSLEEQDHNWGGKYANRNSYVIFKWMSSLSFSPSFQHGPLAERAPNGSTPSQLSESCQLTWKVCPNAYRS